MKKPSNIRVLQCISLSDVHSLLSDVHRPVSDFHRLLLRSTVRVYCWRITKHLWIRRSGTHTTSRESPFCDGCIYVITIQNYWQFCSVLMCLVRLVGPERPVKNVASYTFRYDAQFQENDAPFLERWRYVIRPEGGGARRPTTLAPGVTQGPTRPARPAPLPPPPPAIFRARPARE